MNVKRAPPPAAVARAQIVPPCASTIARQIARPRPTPGIADSLSPARELVEQRCASWPAGRPGPSSHTRHFDRILTGLRGVRPIGGSGRRVLGRILEQVDEHALDQHTRRSEAAAGRRADRELDAVAGQRRFERRRAHCRPASSSDCQSRLQLHARRLCSRAISSRLLTSSCSAARLVADRRRRSRMLASRGAAAISIDSVSASPTSAVSGVRRSCDSAASSELRSRSDSICTQRRLRDGRRSARARARSRPGRRSVSRSRRCSGIMQQCADRRARPRARRARASAPCSGRYSSRVGRQRIRAETRRRVLSKAQLRDRHGRASGARRPRGALQLVVDASAQQNGGLGVGSAVSIVRSLISTTCSSVSAGGQLARELVRRARALLAIARRRAPDSAGRPSVAR